jgi:hypothetical protein
MLLGWLCAASALAACAASRSEGGHGDTDSTNDCSPDGATTCQGSDFMVCENGDWTLSETCAGATPHCDPSAGCLVCAPNQAYCDDAAETALQCNADGSAATVIDECEENEDCVDGVCVDLCASAAGGKSYLGCDFIAVSTTNSQLDAAFDGDFAVVIGNPSASLAAEVTVSRGGSQVASATVQPGDTKAIALPMVAALKNATATVVATGGAYEVRSSIPVIAYQYNPLNFTVGGTFSYTNDASLLLPEHTLTGNYMAVSRPTWGHGSWQQLMGSLTGSWSSWLPGYVTVAALADGTNVTFRSSTYTAAGGSVPALTPGEETMVTLDRGDVLQIFSHMPQESNEIWFCQNQGWEQTNEGTCPPTTMMQTCDGFCSVSVADLTGSLITASQPVAVFAGHQCTFVPYFEWACDHLEEMMFPLETWGDSAVMTAPRHPDPGQPGVVRTLYRIIARDPGTSLTFEPAVHAPVTLGNGQFVEFETDQDFAISASGQFYVAQFLLGQQALGSNAGDPAMGSGVPLFQTRGTYNILVPDTYTSNYVNVVAPGGIDVELDGFALAGWEPIGNTGFSVVRQPVQPGAHVLKSAGDTGFGITSYGYASYTSYLYPGGMNLGNYVE